MIRTGKKSKILLSLLLFFYENKYDKIEFLIIFKQVTCELDSFRH